MSAKKPAKSRRMGSSRRDQKRTRIQKGEGKEGIEDLEVEETMPYTGQEADEATPDKPTEHQSKSLFLSTDTAPSPSFSSPAHLQQSDSSQVPTSVGTPPMSHGRDLMHHEEPSSEDICLIQPERECGTESGNVASADLHEPEEAVSSKGREQPSYSLGPEVDDGSSLELAKKVGGRGSSSLEEASEKESKKTGHMDGAEEALPPIPNRREKRRKLGSTRKSTKRAELQLELEETADVTGQGCKEGEQSSLLEEDTEGHREDSGICTHTQEASNDSDEVGQSNISLDTMEECEKEREMEQINKDDTHEMSGDSGQVDHSPFVRDEKSHKEFQLTLDRAENKGYDMEEITTHDIPFEDSAILNQMDQTQDSMLSGNDSALNININDCHEDTIPQEISLPTPLRRENRITLGSTCESSVRAEEQIKSAGEQDVMRPEGEEGDLPLLLEDELSSEIASSGEFQVGKHNEIIIHQITDQEEGVQGHSRDTETFSILSHTPEIDYSEQAEHLTLSVKNETENKRESTEEHEKEPVATCQACDITDDSEREEHTLLVREDSHSETQVTLTNTESTLHSEAEITKQPNTFEGAIILEELNQTTDSLLEGKASDSQCGNPETEDRSPESEEGQIMNVKDNSFEGGNMEEVLSCLTEESELNKYIKSKEREEKTGSEKDQTVVIDGLSSKMLVQAKDPVTTEDVEGGVGPEEEQGEESLLLEELGFEVIAPSGKLWTETSTIHETTDHEKELMGGRETSGIFSENSLTSDYSEQAKHPTLLVETGKQDEEKCKDEKEMEHARTLEKPDVSDHSNQEEHTLLARNAIDTGHQQEHVQTVVMGHSEVEIKIYEDMIDDSVILSHLNQSEDSPLMEKGSGLSTNLDASQCQSPESEVCARESEQGEMRTLKDSSSAEETAGVVLCSQGKESDYEENAENIAKEEDLSLEKCPTFNKNSGSLGILEQSPNLTATKQMKTAKQQATQLPLEVESLSVRCEGEFDVQEGEEQGQTDESCIGLDAKKERRKKLGSTRKSSRRAKLQSESGGEEEGGEQESENRETSSLLEEELGLGIVVSSGEIQAENLKEFTIHLSTDEEKGLEWQKEERESSRIFHDTSDTSGDYENAENSTVSVENERENKDDSKDKSEIEQFRLKNTTHISDCSDQFENEELHFDSQLTIRTKSVSDNEAKASKHGEIVVIDQLNQSQGHLLIENRSVLDSNHNDSQLRSPESENPTQKSEEEEMGNVEVNCPQETNVEDALFILTEEKWHGEIRENKDTSLPIAKGRDRRRKMGSTRKTFRRVEEQTETGVVEDMIGQGGEEGEKSILLQEELTYDTASGDSEQREDLELEKKQEHEDESKAERLIEKSETYLAFNISDNSVLGEDSTFMTVKKTDGDTQLTHPSTVSVEPSATENIKHDNIIEDLSFRSEDEISTPVGEGNIIHTDERVIAPDAKDRSAGTMVEDIVLPLTESPPIPNRAERRKKLGSTRKISRKAELRAEVGEDEDMMGSEGKASSLLEGELGFDIPEHASLKGPETQEQHSAFPAEQEENVVNKNQKMEMHYTPNISTHCDEAGHTSFVKDAESIESTQNEFQTHSVGSSEAESINKAAEETVLTEQVNPGGGTLHTEISSELTVSFYGSQEKSQEIDGHTQTCDNQATNIGQPSARVHNPSDSPHRRRKMGSTRRGFLHSHNQAEQKQPEESQEKDEGQEKELGGMYKAKDANDTFEGEKGKINDVDLERETEIKQLDYSHQGNKECSEEMQQSKRDAALRDTESTGREDSASQEDGGNGDAQRSKKNDVAIIGSMDKPTFLEPPESSTSDGMQEKAGPVNPQLPAVRKKLGSSRRVKQSTWKGNKDLGHSDESGVEEDPKAAAVLHRIQEIFRDCNPAEKGFITWDHMQGLSGELGLSIEELRQVFDRLDKDKDGLVTTQDVSASFREFMQIQHRRAKPAATVYQSDASILAEEEEDSKGTPFMTMLDGLKAYSLLQDQSEIWSLWVELQHTEPHLLKNLEDFVSKVAEQIKTIQQEKESLELALKRQIRRHSIAVKELYEEMERQITSEKEGVKRESLEKSRSQLATTEEELDQRDKEILALHVVQKQLEGSIGELRRQQLQSSVEREELLRTNEELEQQLVVIRGQLEKLSHVHAPQSGHAHQRPRPLLLSLTDRGRPTEDSSGSEVLNLHSNVQNEPRRISHGAVGFERSGSVFDQETCTGAEGDARRRVISIEEDPMPDLLTGRQASPRRKQGEALWEKQRAQASGSFSGPSSELDLLYNVVLVGNSNVGKTCFLKRFQTGEFSPDFCATVGLDSCIQTVQVDGRRVILQLWDTAGQERFHSITKQILRKAQGLLLMYDITSSQSFTTLSYWLSTIQEGAPDDVIIMLLANKNDGSKREVSMQEGEALAREYNIHFIECSAATGDNVVQAMNKLARLLKQQVDKKQKANVTLHKEPMKKKSGCCG